MKSNKRLIRRIAVAALAVGLAAGPAGAQIAAPHGPLTPVWRRAVVEGVAAQLVQAYFDRSVADKIAARLRKYLGSAAYEAETDPAEFARLLTTHLREVNGDLHLTVRYSRDPLPERRTPSEPTADEIASQRQRAASANFGFTELRLLRANIGYPSSILRISIEGERLIAQVEGRARRYEFIRRADGSYFAPNDRVVMRVLRNDTGQVVGLDWFEGGGRRQPRVFGDIVRATQGYARRPRAHVWGAAVVLTAVALAATVIPAYRAARINPVRALRQV